MQPQNRRHKAVDSRPFIKGAGEGGAARVRCVRHSFAIAGWAAGAAAMMAASLPARAVEAIAGCSEMGPVLETVEAVGARDGATLRLVDGRDLRLAGVVAASALDGDVVVTAQATDALNKIAAGKSLALHGRDGARDRYGRVVAQAAVSGGAPRWLQADLVAAGWLRAAPEASALPCAALLLDAESKARAAGKGLWREARFAVMAADDLAGLNASTGRFAVVEGVVHHVGETTSRTYLDFGRRYTKDFTIVVPRAARRNFAAAGIDLKSLRGRRVRVRGVLFSSGGPAIEIRQPASLELLKGRGI
jgi:endonuclease YncB( thermonuclease family)